MMCGHSLHPHFSGCGVGQIRSINPLMRGGGQSSRHCFDRPVQLHPKYRYSQQAAGVFDRARMVVEMSRRRQSNPNIGVFVLFEAGPTARHPERLRHPIVGSVLVELVPVGQPFCLNNPSLPSFTMKRFNIESASTSRNPAGIEAALVEPSSNPFTDFVFGQCVKLNRLDKVHTRTTLKKMLSSSLAKTFATLQEL